MANRLIFNECSTCENCLYGNDLLNCISLGSYSVIPLTEYLGWQNITVLLLLIGKLQN